MDEQFLSFFVRAGASTSAFEKGIITLLSILLVTILIFPIIYRKVKYKLPPGPTGIPVLGYLPFLGSEPHKVLDKLKHVYGNVFSLYIGRKYTVILANYEALKDAFNQPNILERPSNVFDFIPDGVGFSSVSGAEWVEQRKFCVRSLKDHGVGKEQWESLVQSEVDDFTKLVSSSYGQPIEVRKMLTSSVSNNISAFVLGRRLRLNSPERHFLDRCIDEINFAFKQTSILNIFPILRPICKMLGLAGAKEAYKTMMDFNQFMRKEVENLKTEQNDVENECFITDYLQEMKNIKKEEHYFNDSNLIGNIQALFIGGSETTRTSLYWLLLVIAKYPDIQANVQSEIDSVLGADGQIRWSERKRLPYTFAVIMEGQRWRTLAPLNTARLASEDMKVQGYDIPKGTNIIVNNWGLHHDERYWKDPYSFQPERFLSEDGKEVTMKPESYNPFSYGKRNCPGDTIALMEILLYFTALMQKFTVSPPEGKKLKMEGYLGLTYQSYPQELCFISRR